MLRSVWLPYNNILLVNVTALLCGAFFNLAGANATMRKVLLHFLAFFFASVTIAQTVATPDNIYGGLFQDVQLARIFPDNKTFVDCVPKRSPSNILDDYKRIKNNPAIKFSLKLFIEENFFVPQALQKDYESDKKDIVKHIEDLWKVLRRK